MPNRLLFTSRELAPGGHTLTLSVAGTGNAISAVTLDRADVVE